MQEDRLMTTLEAEVLRLNTTGRRRGECAQDMELAEQRRPSESNRLDSVALH
jgi:hypothetical protein